MAQRTLPTLWRDLKSWLGLSHNNPKYYDVPEGPWVTPDYREPGTLLFTWITPRRQKSVLYYAYAEGEPLARLTSYLPRKLHRVRLKGLPEGAELTFRVGAKGRLGRTLKVRVPKRNPSTLRVVILGDMQPQNEEQVQWVNRMAHGAKQEDPDLVIQLGDFVHRGTERAHWHRTFTAVEPLCGTTPMLGVMGNHDWGYDRGKSWRRFMPYPLHERGKSYYHVDIGPARLLFLDCYERRGSLGGGQLRWIRSLLKREKGIRWLLVFLHGSIFSCGGENMDQELQRQLTPLFSDREVDGVFYGHDHMYEHYLHRYGERGYLFARNHTPGRVPVHYFLSGGGGAPLEDRFGATTRPVKLVTQEFVERATGEKRQLFFERRPFDSSQTLLGAPPERSAQGPALYHTSEAPSQDDGRFFGLQYGENAHHYLLLEVGLDQCSVSAHYADGELLSGPQGRLPQQFSLPRR